MEMYRLISLKLKGMSDSEIQKQYGVSRNTTRKYWKQYQERLDVLIKSDPNVDVSDVIESLIENPKYDTSSRGYLKYSEEIDTLLNQILEDEKEKTRLLGSSHKQKLTYRQIHELIVNEGYDIGITTISEKVKEKRNIYREAYIKQEYEYGDRFEYDFGEVKLIINGKNTKYNLAVLTAPASKFRWAYLYRTQKMDVFIDSQVRFFEMVGGSFKEGVYDNMRNVVTKFIGRNEKEINKELINLALYYSFEINVTNCFSGNEKGSVESAVRWLRNKIFALKYKFDSFEEAETYLNQKLIEINKESCIEEEKKHLLPYRRPYEAAEISTCSVNKYSFIEVDTNFYSVPDILVGKTVTIKKYPNTIKVLYKEQHICTLARDLENKKEMHVDIKHYLNTFLKKPGALRNSKALKSEPELKNLFDKYFKSNPKEFIVLLQNNQDRSIEELIEIIKMDKEVVVAETKLETNVTMQINKLNALFIGGKYVN